MRLDGLLAEEQRRGDLWVRPAVDDEARELELALGERVDAGSVSLARPRATVDSAAELPQLVLGLLAVADCAAGLQRCGRLLELGHGAFAVAGPRERAAGQQP